MNKKGLLIGLIVIIVIVVVAVALSNNQATVDDNGDQIGDAAVNEGGSETFDPTVPDEGEELTEPSTQTAAAPGVEAQLRVFDMTASADGYDPAKIVVNKGDTVSIKLTAPAVGYDIRLPDLGLSQTVNQGSEKKIEFQALTPGTFTYICQDMCPGGNDIKGSLVVKETNN